MGQLILEFPVIARKRDEGKLMIELGNGVRLIAEIPEWAGEINHASLQIVLHVQGSPPDGQPSTASVERVHKTSPDG